MESIREDIEKLPERHSDKEILGMISDLQKDVALFRKSRGPNEPIKKYSHMFSQKHRTLFLAYNQTFNLVLMEKIDKDKVTDMLALRSKVERGEISHDEAAVQTYHRLCPGGFSGGGGS